MTFCRPLIKTVDEEVKRLESMNVVEVITDISILGIHVAKKLGVRVVGVSNYTFYQRYKKMGIDQELTQPFLDAYNQLDVFYELAYADDMSEITCPKEKVGLAVRRVNRGSSNDFKTKFWPSCFLSIGQIANLGRINIDFQAGHVYATGNVEIDGNSMWSSYLDELVIAKTMLRQVPLQLLSRAGRRLLSALHQEFHLLLLMRMQSKMARLQKS